MQRSSSTFVLSSHEVMRGIRVKDDTLVLQPARSIQVNCWMELVVALFFLAASLMAGGVWLITAAVMAVAAYSAVRRARVAVVATEHEVTIRNRWRTRRIPLAELDGATIEQAHWRLRQPTYLWTKNTIAGRDWEVGTIVDRSGHKHPCDALVDQSRAGIRGLGPSPAARKSTVLDRWISDHQKV